MRSYFYDIPTIYTKTLRERSLGVLKVKIKKKFVKTNGSKNISVILIINTLTSIKAPQGESYQDVYDRVVTFIENELNQQQRRSDSCAPSCN